MNEFRVVPFKTDSGKEPFTEWMLNLDEVTRNRIITRIARVQAGNLGDYKFIDNGLFELRFKFGSGYRVYCGKDEDTETIIILLCGGDKGSQKRDIQKAKARWQQYNERKAEKSHNLFN
jgi:putative addiction module killer protein